MTTIAERVAKGAAFLDEHDPEWWRAGVKRAIDLDTLNMIAGDRCVLGQRCPLSVSEYPSFAFYAEHLSELKEPGQVWDWAVALGFTWLCDGGESEDREPGLLTAEWHRVITGRRAAS